MCSPASIALAENCIDYHLEKQDRAFNQNGLDDALVENIDETNFSFEIDDACTLARVETESANYIKVFSGTAGMTIGQFISGGVNYKIEVPFLILQHKNNMYPIKGSLNNVPGTSY